MNTKDMNLSSLSAALQNTARKVVPYIGLLFVVVFAGVYGFVLLRIGTLNNVPANDSQVSDQVQASPSLRIDANAAKQLETLKDNSTNVQSLFDQNRTNPFGE